MTQVLEHIELKDYKAIATAVSNELAASAVERDRQAGAPDEEVRQLRNAGLLPLVVPKAYGGVGATWIEAFKIVQELSKGRWFHWAALRQPDNPISRASDCRHPRSSGALLSSHRSKSPVLGQRNECEGHAPQD
jgi:hypothetical protein